MKKFCLLALILLVPACSTKSEAPSGSETGQQQTGTVTIEILGGDSVQRYSVPDVPDGTTLETVLVDLTEPTIEIQGSGTTAFVNRIGDLATSASEGWTYKIDGEFVNTGVGTTELHPPTTVSWNYGDFSMMSAE